MSTSLLAVALAFVLMGCGGLVDDTNTPNENCEARNVETIYHDTEGTYVCADEPKTVRDLNSIEICQAELLTVTGMTGGTGSTGGTGASGGTGSFYECK